VAPTRASSCCDYTGERKKDDPIVSPGVESFHMHDFFGNTTTDRNSTLQSLRAGGTTCLNPGDKSAYWMPTVKWIDSSGTRTLKANRGLFYYRAGGKADDAVELFPDELRVVTVQGSHVTWKCEGSHDVFPSPPSRCSSGKLVVRIVFPDCSDGNIDSATHRSHMTYAETQSDGTMQCPPRYPKPRPGSDHERPVPHPHHFREGEALLRPLGRPSGVYHARRLLPRLGEGGAYHTDRQVHQSSSVYGR
jgi:hypothetical protein